MFRKYFDKNNIIRIIWMLGILMLEFLFFSEIVFDYKSNQFEVKSSEIMQYQGYEKVAKDFVKNSEDPNFVLYGDFIKTNKIVLNFSKELEADTNVQVFYAEKRQGFNELSSRKGIIQAGKTQWKVSLPFKDYTALRFDIDGDFSLEKITFNVYTKKLNPIKLILCVLVSVFFVFLGWKKCLYFPIYYTSVTKKLYDAGYRVGIRIEHCFLCTSIIVGIAFSFLISPEQVPDEWAHYTMMVTEFGFPQYDSEIDKFYQNIDSRNIQRNTFKKQNVELLRKHAKDKFSTTNKDFQGASIKLVSHLPAGVGFFIGVSFHAPIIICMCLAEIFSVIFYSVIGFWTLKIMPFKKELLCAVMLLPMTVQQCASVNYDAVLLPICFLSTAYVLDCIYAKKMVGWKDVLVFGILILVISLIKPPYVFIFLLLLLVPKEKWNLKIGKNFDVYQFLYKYKWFCVLAIGILCWLTIYFLRNISYVKILIISFVDFPQFIKVVINTLKENIFFYIRSACALFGWLDTVVPMGMYVLIILALALFSQSQISIKEYTIKKRERIGFIIVGCLIVILVITIMFTWTFRLAGYDLNVGIQEMVGYLNSITISLGVQGRYYIPVIPLILLPLHGIIHIEKKELLLIQIIYYPVLFIWCAQILLYRYWI